VPPGTERNGGKDNEEDEMKKTNKEEKEEQPKWKKQGFSEAFGPTNWLLCPLLNARVFFFFLLPAPRELDMGVVVFFPRMKSRRRTTGMYDLNPHWSFCAMDGWEHLN